MSTATDMVTRYLAAEEKILAGQIVIWGDQHLTLADLSAVRRGRKEWEQRVSDEQRKVMGDYSPARSARADFS